MLLACIRVRLITVSQGIMCCMQWQTQLACSCSTAPPTGVELLLLAVCLGATISPVAAIHARRSVWSAACLFALLQYADSSCAIPIILAAALRLRLSCCR